MSTFFLLISCPFSILLVSFHTDPGTDQYFATLSNFFTLSLKTCIVAFCEFYQHQSLYPPQSWERARVPHLNLDKKGVNGRWDEEEDENVVRKEMSFTLPQERESERDCKVRNSPVGENHSICHSHSYPLPFLTMNACLSQNTPIR